MQLTSGVRGLLFWTEPAFLPSRSFVPQSSPGFYKSSTILEAGRESGERSTDVTLNFQKGVEIYMSVHGHCDKEISVTFLVEVHKLQ